MTTSRLCLLGAFLALSHDSEASNSCSFLNYYPKRYPIYHLHEESIEIDGKLDDDAWKDVPWTDSFIDIRGTKTWTQPWFKTRVKMRYDDEFLYVAAYMEENEIWANMTHRNDIVFTDNDFEIFVDPMGSTHYYKEFEMNAINTTWNLLLNKPYRDNGHENSTRVDPEYGFDLLHYGLKSGVYIKGKPNDPRERLKYWTAEVALSLKGLVYATTIQVPPKHLSFWRVNFSRVEYVVQVVDNRYEKIPGFTEENWVWSPQGEIAMHMPEKWGYVQFRDSPIPQDVPFVPYDDEWPVRYLAFQLYYAQSTFNEKNDYYATTMDELIPYFDGKESQQVLDCMSATWKINKRGYIATIKAKNSPYYTGIITENGYLTVATSN
ncbi:hypothetical protein THRCLA_03857 [Thraustotheca clavata]|uniref:Carbohydrate-binding domain-containing protein n=1 Tax=Thraustotheca clavata TaxID=74557 RepID=A0A1W0A0Q8_9STRA|nr:hypothetical protein THRCLA_03857 [Thraustotheca clavata]